MKIKIKQIFMMLAFFPTAYELARFFSAVGGNDFRVVTFEYFYIAYILIGMFALRKYSGLYALIWVQSLIVTMAINNHVVENLNIIRALDSFISMFILYVIVEKGYDLDKYTNSNAEPVKN